MVLLTKDRCVHTFWALHMWVHIWCRRWCFEIISALIWRLLTYLLFQSLNLHFKFVVLEFQLLLGQTRLVLMVFKYSCRQLHVWWILYGEGIWLSTCGEDEGILQGVQMAILDVYFMHFLVISERVLLLISHKTIDLDNFRHIFCSSSILINLFSSMCFLTSLKLDSDVKFCLTKILSCWIFKIHFLC